MPTVDLISAIGIIAGTVALMTRGNLMYVVSWLLGAGSMLILVEGLCQF